MADRGRGQQSAGGTGSRGPGGAGGRGRSGKGIGSAAPSASKQGRGVGQQRGGGKDASSKDFRRTAKKTKLTDIDLSPGVAMTAEQKAAKAAMDKAKKAAAAAKTAAAKAAAEKAKKAAAARKAAADKAAANRREQARTQAARDKAARDKAAAAKREAGRGGSSKSKSTGTGGKSPGPRGQRGGTPSPGRSFGRGTGKGQSNTGSRGPGGRGGRSGGRGGGGRGGRGGGRGCFIAETLIQMLDGTTKPIINIQVGEETKGGIVQAKMEFLPDNIYNYKGVEVSGSHWVIEDNQFTEVENSKHGILTDKIETVYCFKTSENRIWVNDIEFGDYESGSYKDWEPHFEQVKEKLNRELLSK